MRFVIFSLIALATSTATFAQDRPIVRAEITPGTVAVGESIELKVTILVPTWFTRPPVYPNLELANAITRLPDDSSYPMRERVGNESWSGIVRSYEVLPLLGASYRLGGQTVSIAYADPGSDPVIMDVEIPEVVFQGLVPAGAVDLDPYLAGRSLVLSLSIEGEIDDLEVGDALVLNYIAELEGLPAMFLPPLAPALAFEGVSIYADSPDLDDGAMARRSEKLTLVFDAGGDFVVPDLTLSFWNTATEAIDSTTVEGFAFSVAGPAVMPSNGGVGSEGRWLLWISVAAGASFLAVIIYLLGPATAGYFRVVAEKRRGSEPYAFAAVQTALRANSTDEAYRAMLVWLPRLNPGMSMRQLAQRYGDAALVSDVESLSRMNYSRSVNGIDGDASQLARGLAEARGRYISQLTVAAGDLPPLNP
jgi:hypothetical protein